MGSVVIISIRFTALGLDSSRSNRISFDYSISFDFLRTCRPSKEYWTDDNNSSRVPYIDDGRKVELSNARTPRLYR